MKKRLIIIAAVLAALLLVGFRYSVVEQEDILPEEVRLSLNRLLGVALAEEAAPPPEETPVPAAEPTAEPTPEPVSTPEPLLERGDSGDGVKEIQTRLSELGFMTGAADGQYGPKTERAVAGFKEHMYDLYREDADRRQAAHEALIERAVYEQEAALEAQIPARPTPLYEQEAALRAQIPELPEEPAKADEPAAAEKPAFEGKVDEETYRLLMEQGFDEYQTVLRSGSRGAEVRRLQRRLQSLGYLTGQADGVFGGGTAKAVSQFQKRNSLIEDGIAGERTQRLLYSVSARRQVVRPDHPYLIKISTEKQRVYAYAWNEADEAYTTLARTMVCSTGLAATPTPKGTFKNTSPVVRWGYFPKYDVWAQYLYRIQGPYLFHSVLYDEADESTVKWGSVNKLGSPASHGCIRLSVEDAKWIYENCPKGTTVTVY